MHRLLRDFAYYGRVAKELIFPRRCAVCATNIDNGYVCEQCRKEYLLQRQLPCCPREEYLAGQAAPLRLMFCTVRCCSINMMACLRMRCIK